MLNASSLIQLLTSAAVMASSIFIPLMAQSFGASAGVVGVLVGIYNTCYLLSSYLFGLISDKYGGKYVLRLGLLLSVLFFALQIFAGNVFSLFTCRALAGMAAGIFPAALAVYAYAESSNKKMGRFTGSGSLGWAIGAILAGLIVSNQSIFALSSIFFGVAFFVSLQMKVEAPKAKAVNLFPFRLIRRNARIYIPYFFRALGAQAIWSIFPLYLVWAGADKLWVGIAYFVNTFSHFFIMQYMEKYRNLYLVNVGLFCSVLTFMGYALFPYLPAVLALQLLLAFSFSTLSIGTIQELLSKNIEQSTAVSLLNSMANFTAAIGPFIAGALAQYYGYPGVMWFGVITTLLGLVCFTTVLTD